MTSRRATKIALLVVIAGGIAVLYASPLRQYLDVAHMREIVRTLRALWYGPLVLIAGYAIGCVFALPASIFVIGAGVIFGWKLGALYAMCGGLLGATASYFAGRFLGEGLLERFGRAGEAVARQARGAGFVSLLIARLIPGPPFALWNYASGIARMSFRDYFAATALGMLPSHIIFTYCADALVNGTMSQGDAARRLAIVGVLLISLVAGTTLLKKRFAPRGQDVGM